MEQVNRIGFVRGLALVAIMAATAAAQNRILVVRPAGATFEEAEKGMAEALGAGWSVQQMLRDKSLTPAAMAAKWKEFAPNAIVLMDNGSVSMYKEARAVGGDTTTPVVALMGVRIDLAIAGLSNAVGINYEIPAVTSMVNLRSIVLQPLAKVGVAYRATWKPFFDQQSSFCTPEGLTLVGRAVADEGDPTSALRKALDELVDDEKVDALWILNDNLFLNPKIIQGVWMPRIRKSKVLSVVGIEPLVNPGLDFGSFAVLPDHYALGSQVAGLVQEIQDAGWKVEGPRADQPLSVVKILNARQVNKRGGVKPDKLGEIDKVME